MPVLLSVECCGGAHHSCEMKQTWYILHGLFRSFSVLYLEPSQKLVGSTQPCHFLLSVCQTALSSLKVAFSHTKQASGTVSRLPLWPRRSKDQKRAFLLFHCWCSACPCLHVDSSFLHYIAAVFPYGTELSPGGISQEKWAVCPGLKIEEKMCFQIVYIHIVTPYLYSSKCVKWNMKV